MHVSVDIVAQGEAIRALPPAQLESKWRAQNPKVYITTDGVSGPKVSDGEVLSRFGVVVHIRVGA